MTKIYHNNRCSKSRCAFGILEEQGEEFETVEYLKTPPSTDEIKELLSMLDMEPLALIRKGEAIFKEQYKGKNLSNEAWIEAMATYPILIERPIVVKNGKAIIGRPPEGILDIL